MIRNAGEVWWEGILLWLCHWQNRSCPTDTGSTDHFTWQFADGHIFAEWLEDKFLTMRLRCMRFWTLLLPSASWTHAIRSWVSWRCPVEKHGKVWVVWASGWAGVVIVWLCFLSLWWKKPSGMSVIFSEQNHCSRTGFFYLFVTWKANTGCPLLTETCNWWSSEMQSAQSPSLQKLYLSYAVDGSYSGVGSGWNLSPCSRSKT